MNSPKSIIGFAFVGIVLCTGCESPRTLEEGGYYPKEERFTLKEGVRSGREIGESRLNFNAVYIDPFAWKSDSGGTFFRFWPTGEMMSQMFSAPITDEKAERFTKAYLGHYTVNGEQIVIEVYSPIPGQAAWGYMKSYGKFHPEGILFTRTVLGNIEKEESYLYREQELGDLEKQPHW